LKQINLIIQNLFLDKGLFVNYVTLKIYFFDPPYPLAGAYSGWRLEEGVGGHLLFSEYFFLAHFSFEKKGAYVRTLSVRPSVRHRN
jgi:hypothetical protein